MHMSKRNPNLCMKLSKNPSFACIHYCIACMACMIVAWKVNDRQYNDIWPSISGFAMEIEDMH